MAEKKKQPPLKEFTERSTYEVTVYRMSDEALREFICGYCDGQIFTSAQIPDSSMSHLPVIFMPLALGVFREHTEKEIEERCQEIGVFWEWMSKRGPMAINGMPTFFSCHIMHVEDWKRARVAINAELERRKDIPLPPAEG
jgi:hypothetical protein